jgi:hypothetical protein
VSEYFCPLSVDSYWYIKLKEVISFDILKKKEKKISSTKKTDRHDITEILLKVALSTMVQFVFFFFKLLSSSQFMTETLQVYETFNTRRIFLILESLEVF